MSTDDETVMARLRAADPARHDEPPPGWLDRLTETTMQTTLGDRADDSTTGRPGPRGSRSRLAIAAAVAVGAGALGIALTSGDAPVTPAPAAARPTVTLAVAAADPSLLCLALSPEGLRGSDVAFGGTVTAVTGRRVTLDVEKWWTGGTDGASTVVLTTPGADAVALVGAVDFTVGDRYLVSATAGRVDSCGRSGDWTPELAALYDAAF